MKTTPARTLLKELLTEGFLHLGKGGSLVLKNAKGESFPLVDSSNGERSFMEITPAQVEDSQVLLDPLYEIRKRAKDLINAGVTPENIASLFAEIKEEESKDNGTNADSETVLHPETGVLPGTESDGTVHPVTDEGTPSAEDTQAPLEPGGETDNMEPGVNGESNRATPIRGSRRSTGGGE